MGTKYTSESNGHTQGGSQNTQNTRLLGSPVIRCRVIERARHHYAIGGCEISQSVVQDLKRDWPSLTERDVDAILAGELFARTAEAESYREAMQAGLSIGLQALRDARDELIERAQTMNGKPKRIEATA